MVACTDRDIPADEFYIKGGRKNVEGKKFLNKDIHKYLHKRNHFLEHMNVPVKDKDEKIAHVK